MISFLYSTLLGFFEVFPLSGAGVDTLLTALLGEQIPALGSSWIWGALLGTLVIAYQPAWQSVKGFGAMVAGLGKGKFKWRKASKWQMMSVYALLAALPLAVMLWILQETGIGSGLGFIGLMFVASAALLFIGDHTVCRNTPLTELTAGHCVKLALFQAVALIPGLSRIGVTMGMGLNMGFKREDIRDFTFILTIPALLMLGLWNISNFAAGGWLFALLGIAGGAVGAVLGGLLFRWLFKKSFLNIAVGCGAVAGIATIVYSLVR
ncbi:MAG: undecaprenyl-diphosphate phosphatase [Clostridia bacterium]|nr:undecaprenyl-diphosphate phosphatase [Clostridia bacterium]